MNVKTVKLKYINKWIEPYKEVYVPEYRFKKVGTNHYKRYYNTLCVLAKVGGCARNVLDYLCERMDNENMIHSNASFRNQFIKDINSWTEGNILYTDASVKKAIHTLVSKKLLLKTEKRGSLRVNPEYFWKGEETHRFKKIQMILEYNVKTPTVPNEEK